MRIVFSSAFDDGAQAVARAAAALAEAQRQVSSGRRIGVPSDDPLGTVTAVVDHAMLDRLGAYSDGAAAGAYRLGVADSVLSDIVNQLTAAQTTALAARGSSQTQPQRDALANELLAIRDALLSDINTQFQGTYLFSGANVTVPPFVLTAGGISAYQGDAAPSMIDIGPNRSVSSTFDGGRILQGTDPQHVLDALTALAADVAAGNDAGMGAGIAALNRSFDRAVAAQARVGNELRSIDDSRAQLSSARTGTITRLSHVEDANLSEAIARLTQAETAYRAALGAVATLGRMTLMDYLR